MIVKGSARSGPAQLAAYLLRSDEHAMLIELLDGGKDLDKAFMAWHAIGEASRGEKTLYHAQISPETKYPMTEEQWKRAAQILAEELGMKDHPRAIVVHQGHDRPHAHVVFQRGDSETFKLWDDSFNYVKHERASLRMAQEFKHEIVPGKHAKRDRKKQPEFRRQKFTKDEAQYEQRTGLSKEERTQQITALHAAADNGRSFKAALEDAGYVLAQGDRGYIVVDQKGGQSVLSRNVGLKKKEIEAFMAGVELEALPTIEEAKALQAERRKKVSKTDAPAEAQKQPEAQGVEASKFLKDQPAAKAPEPKPAWDVSADAQKAKAEDAELEAIRKALAERQAKDWKKWADFHAHELGQLEFEADRRIADKLADRDTADLKQMQALKDQIRDRHKGIKGVLDAIENRWNPKLGAEKAKERRRELAHLKRRQAKERADYAALLEQVKQEEIAVLKERQALQRQQQQHRHDEEKERYIREHHDAKRILAELEQERIKQEERDRNDSLREGPPPPRMGK